MENNDNPAAYRRLFSNLLLKYLDNLRVEMLSALTANRLKELECVLTCAKINECAAFSSA